MQVICRNCAHSGTVVRFGRKRITISLHRFLPAHVALELLALFPKQVKFLNYAQQVLSRHHKLLDDLNTLIGVTGHSGADQFIGYLLFLEDLFDLHIGFHARAYNKNI